MKKRLWLAVLAGLMLLNLAGCGSDSGGGAPSGPTTQLKGTVSAGIVYPGSVKIYAVSASGAKGALLAGPVATSIDGTYSASLGSYSGAVEIEASGSYRDEATGHSVTIDPAKPLHAMVEAVDGTTHNNRVASVTPLTEIAWRKASGDGTGATTPAAMESANRLVDDLFKVGDILAVEPVRPDNASMAHASQQAQAYTLALAALSKMASNQSGATDADKLESMLSGLKSEVEGAELSGRISSQSETEFHSALNSLTLGDDFPSARDQFPNVGKKSKLLTLAVTGTLPAGARVYSIQGTLALPVNGVNGQLMVALLTEENGMALSDVLKLAGNAVGLAATEPVANFMAAQQEMSFSVVLGAGGPGIGLGDFATLSYDVVGAAVLSAADFSLVPGSVKITDASGVDLVGVTVGLR